MYLEYYGLREPPFSITPDPRFVFLSERHRDALAHLLYGIGQGGGGGFVQLTGEVGTGKTTLSRLLLEQLPDNARVALVLNPRLSPVELLETICEELHLDLDGRRGSLKQLVDLLNRYLLEAYAQGLRVVLIIDEAQNLSVDALEQVRLLTNLETDTQKLLQIILLGQPELRSMLAREDLRQLAQRITARFHLTPLSTAETDAYLRHRYKVAGGQRFPFTEAATRRIHTWSRGVPRLTNVIAERALLAGYAHDESMIGPKWVDAAATEVLATAAPRGRRWPMALAAGVAVLAIGTAAWLWPRTQAATTIDARRDAAPVPTTRRNGADLPAADLHSKTGSRMPVTRAQQLDATGLTLAIANMAGAPSQAWRPLLQAWSQPAIDVDAAAACPPQLGNGLRCLQGTGKLDTLVALGRPLMLKLQADGHTAWAALLGADAVRLRLHLGARIVDIDRIALDRVWRGEYAALWRAPAPVQPPFTGGQYGPGVDWIHARLQPAYTGPAVLDAAMADAIRAFQATRGIVADGVVGPQTLMALAARDPGPRLRTVLE
ncbi:ExeA family protein [Aerolutibacter ruishenii]|uniref:General secretion pathway protein A n=1 Tax=Aerolutibacter ruishenii TaxID=686800 RepID=A0A562LKV3_9GAMM|nr:ExeA family protein [Lysobacter ruishenii]TWI08216.1 general secretion pathway protein A [Lysobacter ruishenii]